MMRRMVITGASGFIGRQLVPRLQAHGIELTLVGRNPALLGKLFPGVRYCGYGKIAENARDFDALVHLAVLNNNASARLKEFDAVNIDLLSDVVAEAQDAGIKAFVNVSSFHALCGVRTPYADSKRRALKFLNEVTGIFVVNLFLPTVYGDDYAGKLAIIKKVPPPLKRGTFVGLAALMPTLHVDRFASYLIDKLDEAETQVMLANPQDRNPIYRWGRWIIDALFTLAVIGLLWWLLVLIWVLIRLTSKGPGIFAQERVGKDGEPFTCYKFRTMHVGTRQVGTHEVAANAVTSVGAILRKSKLDELPQVWNIIRGDLSLVGPRPSLSSQESLIHARKKRRVLDIRPGITGLAQVRGIDMRDPEKLAQIDGLYIAQRGLLTDVTLIIATLIGRGRGDKIVGKQGRSDAPKPS